MRERERERDRHRSSFNVVKECQGGVSRRYPQQRQRNRQARGVRSRGRRHPAVGSHDADDAGEFGGTRRVLTQTRSSHTTRGRGEQQQTNI